jgi:polyhydroxybutyrate depolymerase
MRPSILTCLLFISAACDNFYENGILKERHIISGGKVREYTLYMPQGLKPHSPLVMAFHGYTGSDKAFMNYSGLNRVARKYGFAVCYPQGLRDSTGKTFWQVGYSFHRNQKVDDVKFISILTKFLQSEYRFDINRTYATGVSNGGDMCILLACRQPDLFKAVAPVIGCMMKINLDSCRSSLPIPVFMINSTKDPITWWDGDMNDKEGWGPYLPVLSTYEFFSRKNNCTSTISDTLPDINQKDSSYIVEFKSTGDTKHNQVWLYSVVNGGHDWPGGSGNMDISAAEEIWKFFSETGAEPEN